MLCTSSIVRVSGTVFFLEVLDSCFSSDRHPTLILDLDHSFWIHYFSLSTTQVIIQFLNQGPLSSGRLFPYCTSCIPRVSGTVFFLEAFDSCSLCVRHPTSPVVYLERPRSSLCALTFLSPEPPCLFKPIRDSRAKNFYIDI